MENIISQGQKILINGKETVDPLMIGYSILDAIENGFELRLVKETENVFQNKDMVYLLHDPEQKIRMITSIHIDNENVLYEMICGTEVSAHYSFEISREKNPALL